MANSTKVLIGLVIIILLGSIAFFTRQKPNNESLKIGVILPLTGSQATYGEGLQEGFTLAKEELDKRRGALKTELVYENNNGETKQSVSAAEKLISVNKVDLLVVAVSQHALAVAPIAERAKVPMLVAGGQASKLNTAGDYVFKNDDVLAKVGAAIAPVVFAMGHKHVGIISSNYNDAVLEARDAFVHAFQELGGDVTSEGIAKDDPDLRSAVTKVLSDQPTAIVLNGLAADNARLIKELQAQKNKVPLFGTSAIEDKQVLDAAGSSADGIIFASFNPVPPDDFVAKVQTRFGHKPLRWTAESYDAHSYIVQSVLDSQSSQDCTVHRAVLCTISPASVQLALSKLREWTGATGHFTFDSEGNAQRPVLIKVVRNGNFELYK